MSAKAKAIQTLYKAKRITIEGLKTAIINCIITLEEYKIITGEDYR